MNDSTPNLVPLQQASLCLDCETITAAHSNCHACGSRALLNIARALDQPGYRTPFRSNKAVMPAVLPEQIPRMADFVHST